MPRTKDQASRNVGGISKGSGRDMGKDTPSYKGASIKGLTSKDPANVARNRAGAARYASKSERIAASGKDSNADKAAIMAAYRASRPATAEPVKAAPAAAAPKPTMTAVKPPASYRPGIDPEFNYNAPTVTLAKGGKAKAKPKGKKK